MPLCPSRLGVASDPLGGLRCRLDEKQQRGARAAIGRPDLPDDLRGPAITSDDCSGAVDRSDRVLSIRLTAAVNRAAFVDRSGAGAIPIPAA